MDPNLEKIRDTNIESIRKGKLGRTLAEAKSYLTYILIDTKCPQLSAEFEEFAEDIVKRVEPGNSINWREPRRRKR